MHHVETVGHCAELLKMGIANRITSATTMNAHSSRLVFEKKVRIMANFSANLFNPMMVAVIR